jgi:PKHD-type hydroxylase
MSQQFFHIQALLTPEELAQIETWVATANFVDGKATASMAAKSVKNNTQINSDDPVLTAQIHALLNNAIATSPLFQIAAQPKSVYPFIISRYGAGQYYGWHVDSPIMGNPAIRTDLAMTIFLSDPATYMGGELVLQTGSGPLALKPAKGDAILYPCQYLHCVNEVTVGERLAAITWVQSNIPSVEQRTILFQLNQVHAQLQQTQPQAPATSLLLQTYSNLFRMWADV